MSEVAPVTDESAVVEGVAEQPTIHDQAYWDQDAETAAQNWEQFRGTRLVEMDKEQMTALIGYMWKAMWQDHQVIKQMALEAPLPTTKASRKRAPKARQTAPAAPLETPDETDAA